MAEYLPLYKPGQALTLKASAVTVAGQVVMVTGVNTVGPCAAASVKVVGVAGFDAAINDYVTVYAGGVQVCTASGGITAGDPVVAGAAGTVVSSAVPPLGQRVGVALNTAVDTAKVRVLFT